MTQLLDATGTIVDDRNYTEAPDFDFGTAEVIAGGETLDETVAEFVTVATGSVEEFFTKFQALDDGAGARDLDSEDVLAMLKDGDITIDTDLEDVTIYDDFDDFFEATLEIEGVDPDSKIAILVGSRVEDADFAFYFYGGDAHEIPSGKYFVFG